MAQNYATTASKKVDERFKRKSLTDAIVNHGYDLEWSGAKTVRVYSVDTVAETDYTRTGSNRYGDTTELGTEAQDLTLTQDKGTSYSIDRGNMEDSMYAQEVGKSLARQTDQVYIPNTDAYRLGVLAAAATTNDAIVDAATEVTAENAYTILLNAGEMLDDADVPVPEEGRVAYVSPKFYKLLKLDDNFIKNSDLGQKKLITGQIGEADGAAIVKASSKLMPENVDLILVHKSVLISPKKIDSHKVHDNPPGINGKLVEVRRYFDAFVLGQKTDGIAIHTTA